jgi:hypothetical protein
MRWNLKKTAISKFFVELDEKSKTPICSFCVVQKLQIFIYTTVTNNKKVNLWKLWMR